MEHNFHPFHELFKQLGLECAPAAIEAFLRMHAPIPPGVTLPDAPFWSPSQAAFLRDALAADSDWAEVVDALNAALRCESVGLQ
jgi:hypothetical protein